MKKHLWQELTTTMRTPSAESIEAERNAHLPNQQVPKHAREENLESGKDLKLRALQNISTEMF